MALLFTPPFYRATDNINAPIAGAFIGFYSTQTSTLAPIYADAALTIALQNPVQADGDGNFPAIFLDDSLDPYKYVIYYPDSQDPTIPGDVLRSGDPFNPLADLTPLAQKFYPLSSGEHIANITPANYFYPPGHLLRYGVNTVPGTTDMTAAANAATLSISPYQLFATLQEIVFPPGPVAINGTVYVRKGQRVRGSYGATYLICNNSGTGPTFKMGWGNINGTPTVDSGGQPCSVEDMYFLGGPSQGCVDFTNIAGAVCRDCFFSASGLAININSANDLQISGIFFDVHQGGISISGTSQNLQISNVSFFDGKSDIIIGGSPADIQISNLHSEYNNISSVLLSDAAVIRGLKFTDCEWLYNEQFATFTGTILNRSASAHARFDACTFHNMPGYAYQYGTGSGSIIDFNNCLFDGLRTVSISPTIYTQSTLAAAISTANETMRLNNCSLRNLPGNGGANAPIAFGGSSQSTLEILGGGYSGNNTNLGTNPVIGITNSSSSSVVRVTDMQGDATQALVNAQATVPIFIRGCRDWFGPIGTVGGSHYVTVPYQFSNIYQFRLTANQNVGGSGNYRKSILMFVEKDNDFNVSAKSFLVTAVAVQGADHSGTSGNGTISITAEFGAVGGSNSIASSNSGLIALSWSSSYTSEQVDIQML